MISDLETLERLNLEPSTKEKKKMYGWRAKIGHVAPSRGDTLVYEF